LEFCVKMALKKGKVDIAIAYRPEDIDPIFYNKNKAILDLRSGNGLWLWKPYFIYKKLLEINENDIVLYCDAASFFFKDCKSIINSMDDDIWVSNIPLIEKQFTKPELFQAMGCTDTCFKETNQIQATVIAFRKSDKSVRFVKEWLDLCSIADNLQYDTIYDKVQPDFKFFGHRADQSVLSLLSKKYNIKPHSDPSQYGRIPEKYYGIGRIYLKPAQKQEYKPSIILHRGKSPVFKTCINQWLCTWLPLKVVHSFSKPCRTVKKLSK